MFSRIAKICLASLSSAEKPALDWFFDTAKTAVQTQKNLTRVLVPARDTAFAYKV